MTTPSLVRCLAVFALCNVAIAAPNVDELLSGLEKRVPASSAQNYVSALRSAIQQGRYAEADQYLNAFNSAPLGARDPDTVALLDQIRAAIRTEVVTQTQARETQIDKVLAGAAENFARHAPAADYDDLIRQLAKFPTFQGAYNDPSYQKLESARSFVARCQDYSGALASGNTQAAANTLSELSQLALRLPVVARSSLISLQTEAQKATETPDPRYQALKEKLAATIDSASSAADFDPLLEELSKTASPNRYSPAQQKFELLRKFARLWQDYYSYAAAADSNADTTLKQIANDAEHDAIYPRSKVLARLNGAMAHPSGPKIMGPSEVNLANLDEFREQLRHVPAGAVISGTNIRVETIAQSVERLTVAVARLKAGDLDPALALNGSWSGNAGFYGAVFQQMEKLVLRDAVAQSIKAPADLPPDQAENLFSYLSRVVAYGRDHKDWRLVHRALVAQVQYQTGDWRPAGDFQTYSAFFSGLNHEEAGMWLDAARFYQAAIRSAGANAPLEEIRERLKNLKANHPEEVNDKVLSETTNEQRNVIARMGARPLPNELPMPPASGSSAAPAKR